MGVGGCPQSEPDQVTMDVTWDDTEGMPPPPPALQPRKKNKFSPSGLLEDKASAAPGSIRNTEQCFFFARGDCKYGADCYFAHGVALPAGKPRLVDQFSCCCGDDARKGLCSHAVAATETGFKTSLCADFARAEGCARTGSECFGAHGAGDLRTPKAFQDSHGYKACLCTYHLLGDLDCWKESHYCFDAHGELDLRRRRPTLPPGLGVSSGSSLVCVQDRADIWRSPTEYDVIGSVTKGGKVVAAGPPAVADGYVMVPVRPSGAVEPRFFQLEGTGDSSNAPDDAPVIQFSDAHVHLDGVLLQRKYGTAWFYKTALCPSIRCQYGSGCIWAHSDTELRPRPTFSREDLIDLAAEFDTVPGGRFAGCIQSCCGVATIEDTLKLVAWGREILGGRVYASFGIHPTTFEHYTPEVEARLEAALDQCGPQGVAWGECGLDYNKRSHDIEFDPTVRDRMRDVFVKQARVAVRRGLPLVVHSRDAVADVFEVLREQVPSDHPVHLHSFMGAPALMTEFLERWPQLCVGITGAITWPVARKFSGGLADIVRALPLDRLILETDGPFMAPVPHRGEESHAGLIPLVAAGVAKLKGLSVEEVLRTAHANFCRLYRIAPG